MAVGSGTQNGDISKLYWNVNMPSEQWTEECPEELKSVDHWDRAQLATEDKDYGLMSWEEVKNLIDTNHLEDFKRIPSQLRKYRKYIAAIKESHGSVMQFIMTERLKWTDLAPRGEPFQFDEDMKILINDWPYGIDQNVVHLVVWTKFGFDENPESGDLTPRARALIDQYVNKTFKTRPEAGDVAWFKNWAALKSVHAVEHFHVMLHKPDPKFVSDITNQDIPISYKRGLSKAALNPYIS